MDYEELKRIVKPGDIIQIAAPYVAGVGQLKELLEHTMVVEPYVKQGFEQDALPATTVIRLSDVHMLFLLKPNINDANQADALHTTAGDTNSKVSKDSPKSKTS